MRIIIRFFVFGSDGEGKRCLYLLNWGGSLLVSIEHGNYGAYEYSVPRFVGGAVYQFWCWSSWDMESAISCYYYVISCLQVRSPHASLVVLYSSIPDCTATAVLPMVCEVEVACFYYRLYSYRMYTAVRRTSAVPNHVHTHTRLRCNCCFW